MNMKKIGMKLLLKAALVNAKREADSVCIAIGYQPKMPLKVKELKRKDG